MASKKLQLESLKNVPLFSACSKKELEKVAKVADEITMTAGTMIVDQGQTGREAFVIMSGDITIKRSGRKIATLGAGDVARSRAAHRLGDLRHRLHAPRDRPASVPRRPRRRAGNLAQADGRPRVAHPRNGSHRLRLSATLR